MAQKLITVFGAPGAQGSSVIRSLQGNKAFKLRAITRDPDAPAAKDLAASGVEVVKGDGWDKDSLLAAFKGSWGVFVNTNSDDAVFENPAETRTEIDLGKIIVDAAAEAGVEVFVYSGAASAKEATGGKVPVEAFDDKFAIQEYAKSKNAFKAVGIVGVGWYFEEFLKEPLAPVQGGFPFIPTDGVYVLRLPKWGGDEGVPFLNADRDYGDIVHGVFLAPEKWNGKLVQGASDIKSFEQVTQIWEKVTGKKAKWDPLPSWHDLEVFGIRGLETIKKMFGFSQESGAKYFGEKSETETAALLKKAGAEARGASGKDAELDTIERYLQEHFGGK